MDRYATGWSEGVPGGRRGSGETEKRRYAGAADTVELSDFRTDDRMIRDV
ncbi:MAG: hypothetical protein QHG99_02230 [Methanomicrobiales archaeon]|nr:hypothetical protein [Methanomicrobiales archaeon]